MYCTQFCDGYTYCSADSLWPRNVCSSKMHLTLGDLLCAHFPTTPLFFDFRDVRNYNVLYGNPLYILKPRHGTILQLDLSIIHKMDDRIQSRLALVADCMEKSLASDLLVKQRLREYMLQMAPAMIATLRNDPMIVPHRNIRYTTDILPRLPITLANEFMCRLDDDVHNIPLSEVVMAIMWGLMEKTTPRRCMRRCSIDQIAGNYVLRPVFHLTMDVTFLYGFLGCDRHAISPPSLLTSMAIIVTFHSMKNMSASEYRSFVSIYEFVIFLSWILYTFDHIEQQESLRRIFCLFAMRNRYIAAIRESMRCVHTLIERHLRPVAMDILLRNRKKDPDIRLAWKTLAEELKQMHVEYKSQVGTSVIMQTMEPTFECMSIKWMTQMRSAIRDEKIPPTALPSCVRNELGKHSLLSQEELHVISLLAHFNVAVAAQPIPPLLHLLNVSEEALRILTDCVIKFTCRLGAKHAILKDAAECIAKCDLRSVMIIQQFLEHCSVAAGIYLAPLSKSIQDNQIAALRRRFQSTEAIGRFYYCSGCRIKLTHTVRHPNVKSLLCSSMHDLQHLADYDRYLTYKVPQKEGKRKKGETEEEVAIRRRKMSEEKPVIKDIVRRTRRTGCTSGALLHSETGTMMCSGCLGDEEGCPSWCSSSPTSVVLPGYILYVNQKAYTVCVQCGSFCSYVTSAWTPNGPICSVHPPELAAVLHKNATGQFNVLNPTLNAFLNRDSHEIAPAPWMCEISKCRCRCMQTSETVLTDEVTGALRFARLCSDHEETLHRLFGSEKRGAQSMRYHTLPQINEWVISYCSADQKRMRFLNRDGADQYFGI